MSLFERIDTWLCIKGPIVFNIVVIVVLLLWTTWIIAGESLRGVHG